MGSQGLSPQRSVGDFRLVISNQRASIVNRTELEVKFAHYRIKTGGPHEKPGYIMEYFQASEQNRACFLWGRAARNQIQSRPQH